MRGLQISCFAISRAAVPLLLLVLPAPALHCQNSGEPRFYSRANTLGILTAYSNDSSHIFVGDAERRKLLHLGVSYTRRLWIGRIVNWQYTAEILPVVLESDPLTEQLDQVTSPVVETFIEKNLPPQVTCHPPPVTYEITDSNGVVAAGTEYSYCHGRRWTIGEGLSPAGMQWNFRPRHKLQPFLINLSGILYTTKPIPVTTAGAFNFTFDLGGGLELYQSPTRSLRVEYRYHHISNDETAKRNPGIDSGLFQLTWTIGR